MPDNRPAAKTPTARPSETPAPPVPFTTPLKGLPPGPWRLLPSPQVPPLPPEARSRTASLVLRWVRRRTREDFNVFTTLARTGRIFPAHAFLVVQLLFKGRIPRGDVERVILRVAWRMGCAYEWAHHTVMGVQAGVSRAELASSAHPDDESWTPRVRVLMEATDELMAEGTLSAASWSRLRQHLTEDQGVEFCMLVGHYIMAAMIINTSGCRIEPEYEAALAAA
jgi:4-carboxymuconolactone decarboxylase